jgi:hypothetical protein
MTYFVKLTALILKIIYNFSIPVILLRVLYLLFSSLKEVGQN